MLKDYLQIKTLTIVFLGEFNPVIIQPFWLANKKLIREIEAEKAKIEVIHNELVRFQIDEFASFEITKNRFEIKSSSEFLFDALRDLATSIFETLRETPITALGINFVMHFAIPRKEQYYDFGNKLVPLGNWDSFLNAPRLLQLEIIEEKRADGLNGHYRIRVYPSDIKLATNYAVTVNVNDHYTVQAGESGRNLEMITRLKTNWVSSIKRADDVVEGLWNKIIKE